MPFPAQQSPAEAFLEAQRIARQVRAQTAELTSVSAAGDVERDRLIGHMRNLTVAIARWNSLASVPGIVQYAKDQADDQLLDVAGEFTAMVGAATALRDNIFSTFPVAGSGAWEVVSYNNAGEETELTFTTAQLAGYRALCDALVATIAI